MKKVALITWKFHNYGTVLQAFATNYFFNQMVYIPCDLINYDLDKKNLDIPKKYSIFEIIHKIYNRLRIWNQNRTLRHYTTQWVSEIESRESCFRAFIDKIPQTPKMKKESLYSLNSDYDLFICGSDQIWNPNFFDGSYMLDFVSNNKIKIAFSPSFGTTDIPNKLRDVYRIKLSRLDAISVREDVGCEIVQELVHKKALHLCDPTLLLSAKDWERALQFSAQEEQYILCYFLGDNKWYLDMVKKVQEYLNMPIRIIGVKWLSYTFENSEIIHPGPVEFVQAIANASFVITDSIHGMLFSTNFNRKYMVLQRFSEKMRCSENGRLISFMRAAKLEKRYYTKAEDLRLECFENLDSKQMDYIKNIRRNSIQYLLRYIKDDE